MDKRIREALKILGEEGVGVSAHVQNSHLKIYTDHGVFTCPVSASDHRALLNFRSEVRRRVKMNNQRARA